MTRTSPLRLVRAITTSAFACLCITHAHALRAAGINGDAPPNAGAIRKFVSTITSNALWMIGTVSVLAIVIVGSLFFFGHTRATDIAAKIAIGALIVISAGGLAA